MTEGAQRAGERARALRALIATLAIQIFTSLAATATSVLAPEIAPAFGIASKWIGVFIGLVYLGAMMASLACGGFIDRYGAIRVSQVSVLLCAAGAAIIAVAPDRVVPVLVVAAVCVGLGYGAITPASSHVLIRTAPPEKLALTFSIKQTGVPVGAALAGALLPALAIIAGWRNAFLLIAGVGVVVAIASQPTRRALDTDRRPDRRFSPAAIVKPLRLIRQSRALTELALVSFVYAATQMCLTGFIVVYLNESLGWSLVSAGFALTATTLGGVAGRIVWGWIADRAWPPRRVLGIIGIVAGLCGGITAMAGAAWPTVVLLAVFAAFGCTAIGWNGVQLAEVARHAPQGAAGAVTGASGFITFAGVVAGPPIFALLSTVTGSYRAGFAVFAALSALGGAALLRSGSRRSDEKAANPAQGVDAK